eukprot:gene10107-8009_t
MASTHTYGLHAHLWPPPITIARLNLGQATTEVQKNVQGPMRTEERQVKAAIEVSKALEGALSSIEAVSRDRYGNISSAKASAHAITIAARHALKDSQGKVALLETMVGGLRRQLSYSESATQQLSAQVQAGQAELRVAGSMATEVGSELGAMRAKVGQLQVKLDEAMRQLREAEEHRTVLEERVVTLAKLNSNLERQVESLEASLQRRGKEAEAAAKVAKQRISEIEAEATSSAQSLARLEESLAVREQQMADLEVVMEAKAALAAQLEELVKSRNRDVDEATVLCRKREQELASLKQELAQARSLAAAESEQREDELEQLVRTLRQECRVANKEAESAHAALGLIKEDMDSLMLKDLSTIVRGLREGEDLENSSSISATSHKVRADLELLMAEKDLETTNLKSQLAASLAQHKQELGENRQLLEAEWQLQLTASELRLTEAEVENLHLSTAVAESTRQVREQLEELETVRGELSRHELALSGLRQAYESIQTEAEQRTADYRAEMAIMTDAPLSPSDWAQHGGDGGGELDSGGHGQANGYAAGAPGTGSSSFRSSSGSSTSTSAAASGFQSSREVGTATSPAEYQSAHVAESRPSVVAESQSAAVAESRVAKPAPKKPVGLHSLFLGGLSSMLAPSKPSTSGSPTMQPPAPTRQQGNGSKPTTAAQAPLPHSDVAGDWEQISKSARKELPMSLKLVCAGQMIPHPNKVDSGGEDAWFATDAGFGALGVADGVGGWAEENVNPAEYARGIVAKCQQALDDTDGAEDGAEGAIEVMEFAQASIDLEGSCTVCVSIMRPEGKLEVANLGDAGIRIVRGNKVVHTTRVQEHRFNMPFQMASPKVIPETDLAADADTYQEGDVVICGSDGLFDNLFDEQIALQVHACVQKKRRKVHACVQEQQRKVIHRVSGA